MDKKRASLKLKRTPFSFTLGMRFFCVCLVFISAGLGCGSKEETSPTTLISTQTAPPDPAKDE
ncbi:hypothetical protein WDW86_02395, partial [Bdellovibrionota bacterium FG-2]